MIAQPLSSTDLQHFIETHQIEAAILPMAEHTLTVPDAARVLNVETGQIIKSLVFIAKGEPLLVINNGLARVDRRKIAAFLGVGKKQIKFASPEQALEITGYVVGSMPPFGHRRQLTILVDPAISGLDVVFGGGGDIDAMMRIAPPELLRVTAATMLELSE